MWRGANTRETFPALPSAEPRVRVLPFRQGGADGYDLVVTSPEATVADYLAALAAVRLPLTRTRNPGGSCPGCIACCQERVPLTAIDLRQLSGRRDPGFVSRLAVIGSDGPAVDIVLKRDEKGRCLFLDPDRGLCRVYHARPFVCRTFICCPISARARELRGAVTNAGEDELVRLWLGRASAPPGVSRGDWPDNAFTGRWSYREVRLRECVSPSLWHRLYQKERPPGRGGRKIGKPQ